MKMFIFERLNCVSDRYHSQGGLVVIAKDREHVMELIKDYEDIIITKDEWKEVITYDLKIKKNLSYSYFPMLVVVRRVGLNGIYSDTNYINIMDVEYSNKHFSIF